VVGSDRRRRDPTRGTPQSRAQWLADRFGPRTVAACGFLMLAIVGVSGAMVDQDGLLSMVLVLGFLGVRWNFSVVGGGHAWLPPWLRRSVRRWRARSARHCSRRRRPPSERSVTQPSSW
jgi:hypothetical protein